jgi:hypothetical protein
VQDKSPETTELHALLADTKRIACRFYHLTGRPLGVTGEVAEYEAARLLGLDLADVREAAIDATKQVDGKAITFQIKGRAVSPKKRYIGRVSKMKLEPQFDKALLVLIDQKTYETIEIWQSDYEAVKQRLNKPGSKARNERGSLAISQFKSISTKIWPR